VRTGCGGRAVVDAVRERMRDAQLGCFASASRSIGVPPSARRPPPPAGRKSTREALRQGRRTLPTSGVKIGPAERATGSERGDSLAALRTSSRMHERRMPDPVLARINQLAVATKNLVIARQFEESR
jgi:hypothetical protein